MAAPAGHMERGTRSGCGVEYQLEQGKQPASQGPGTGCSAAVDRGAEGAAQGTGKSRVLPGV